ncbi:MHJ_0274 family protein [Mycoplasmopsis columbinasalis]|uniref:Uncharacterized protein n=1 Tax=Mycoplasmopsis columbinasalis TaxID=114880 RepID=A0A449B9M2_9BACT|nr:hypothetical protein [Mycoplasmopsis columbinasalis]VEU77890.1 Uncharacterised protein [Mycoplasmopsis columbinasalis]
MDSIWIIFIVIISLFAIFFVYSVFKDRKQRNQRKKDKIIFANQAREYRRKHIFNLHFLIEMNQQYLDNFQPSIGEYKMHDVIDTARAYLLDFENNKEFKEYIVASDDENELLEAYVNLRDTRSNAWTKKIPQVLDYIQRNFNDYQQIDYQDELRVAKEEVATFYQNHITKNQGSENDSESTTSQEINQTN